MNPIFENCNNLDSEYLVEESSAHYVSAQYAQYGVYDYDTGISLPEGFQTVYRYTKGKFLIVLKRGPYNGISGTYDGRHGDCSVDEFRNYIGCLLKFYSELYDYAKEDDTLKHLSDEEIEHRILSLKEFNINPFKTTYPKHNNNFEMKDRFYQQQNTKKHLIENYAQLD